MKAFSPLLNESKPFENALSLDFSFKFGFHFSNKYATDYSTYFFHLISIGYINISRVGQSKWSI
jgi:hypothetical protein